MIGGTKVGEYSRTVEMMSQKLGKSSNKIAEILYFLYDSQYDNSDLKAMADLITQEHSPICKGIDSVNKKEFIKYLESILNEVKEISPFDTDEECHIQESFASRIEDIIEKAKSII